MATPGRDTRRGPAVGVPAMLAASVCAAVLCVAGPAAVAATDPAGTPPPAAPSIPLPTTSVAAPPPSTSVRPTSAPPATVSTPAAATTTRRYTPPPATYQTVRSSAVPPGSGYALSGIPTSAPTQTFVLGSGSLGSLSASTPVAAGTTAAATSHPGDTTDRDVRIFFTVVAVAAFLFVAGIVGLVLTRDGRGRHR